MGNDPFAAPVVKKHENMASTEADNLVSLENMGAKETEKPVKKAAAPRKNTMAMNGKSVGSELPEDPGFPEWPDPTEDELYIPEEIDFTDLSNLNREINRARSRSFRVKNQLGYARQHETEVTERYRRAFNRALVSVSGSSAEQRKAFAEIGVESLYSEVLIAQGVVKELTSLSYAVSKDLDVLKTISDNLRKQLSL